MQILPKKQLLSPTPPPHPSSQINMSRKSADNLEVSTYGKQSPYPSLWRRILFYFRKAERWFFWFRLKLRGVQPFLSPSRPNGGSHTEFCFPTREGEATGLLVEGIPHPRPPSPSFCVCWRSWTVPRHTAFSKVIGLVTAFKKQISNTLFPLAVQKPLSLGSAGGFKQGHDSYVNERRIFMIS